jgi:hypothetical protein
MLSRPPSAEQTGALPGGAAKAWHAGGHSSWQTFANLFSCFAANERNNQVVQLCFAILVSRLEIVLGVDPFSANTEAPFPVKLGEFIRFYENAVPSLR